MRCTSPPRSSTPCPMPRGPPRSPTAAAAELEFALRDFELEALTAHGALVEQVCAAVQSTEPRAVITCSVTPQYRNMRYWLERDMRPVQLAMLACRQAGIEPFSAPTRGGTDGSRLTELGIPAPNVFTGMQNIHGPLEWVSVQDMARATETCVRLARLWAEEHAKPAAQAADHGRSAADRERPVDWAG